MKLHNGDKNIPTYFPEVESFANANSEKLRAINGVVMHVYTLYEFQDKAKKLVILEKLLTDMIDKMNKATRSDGKFYLENDCVVWKPNEKKLNVEK